jgi:hypothetical protein
VEDCGWWAFGHAGFAVNALNGVNEQHCFTFVEAFDRANRHAIGVLAVEARFSNNVCHPSSPLFGYDATRTNGRIMVKRITKSEALARTLPDWMEQLFSESKSKKY